MRSARHADHENGAMAALVALLRGINVGGRRSVPMATLRDLFAEAGAHEVRTYIQSGNVVFEHPASPAHLQRDLERRIEQATGFDVAVLIRTAGALAQLVTHNPFPDADPVTLHLAFLHHAPRAATVARLGLERFSPETLVVRGAHAYLHLPSGMGRAKLPVVLPKLDPDATVRNWRTVTTLAEMARG